ncbi:MAG: hypothetical protein P8Y51_01945, partial [Campylobacterales bacterium]
MRTLLLLVDDEYAETLKNELPGDKAWILNPRYDAFRCQVRQAFETYREAPSSATTYSDTIPQLA